MGKKVKSKYNFKLGGKTVTYEEGTVTSVRYDLGDYSMYFKDNNTIYFYEGSKLIDVIKINELNTEPANKRIIKEAISSMMGAMEPYNYWFSFSSDADISFDGRKFRIDSPLAVYFASEYNSKHEANYKSLTFKSNSSVSIDKDDIEDCAEAVLAVSALIALAVLCIGVCVISDGAAAPAVAFAVEEKAPVIEEALEILDRVA